MAQCSLPRSGALLGSWRQTGRASSGKSSSQLSRDHLGECRSTGVVTSCPTRTALRLRRPLRLQQRSSSARSPPRAVNRRSPRDRATCPPRASAAGGRRRRPSASRPECRRAAWARVADRRASRSCRETPTIITERQPAATKRRARSGRPEEPDPRHSRRPLPPAIAGVGRVRRRASKSSGAGACERHVDTPLSHVMRASAVSMPALSRVVPCCGPVTSARPLGCGVPPMRRRSAAPQPSLSPRLVPAAGSAHLAADAAAVVVDHLGDAALADAMEVVDAPLELLQRLLGREPTTARSLACAGAPRRRPRPRPSFRGSYRIQAASGEVYPPPSRFHTAAGNNAGTDRVG